MREKMPTFPLPEGEESTLEQFARHEIEHRPNAGQSCAPGARAEGQAQGTRRAAREEEPGETRPAAAENRIASARRAERAVREGALHGALYYAGAEQPPRLRDGRYQESEETVLAKMNSKENFPQG